MKNFTLTLKQIEELRSAHRKAKEKRYADRYKAVILLGTGWTLEKVSEALLLDEETLRSYISRYQQGGVSELGLVIYPGRTGFLSQYEMEVFSKYLDAQICLNAKAAMEFVKEEFDVTYSQSGMTELLHRMGYVYKKPAVVPGKMNVKAQLKFIEDYETVLLGMKQNDALYFMDATHPTHNTMPAYGWIKKGLRKTIKTNSGRQRLNINGAINIRNLDFQYHLEDTINAAATIALFKRLETANPLADKVYVVLDNARYHHSKEVKEYLQNSKVKPLYLPAYSPNLNLIERLWKFFNKRVLYNRYYEHFEQLKNAATDFLGNLKQYAANLKTLLTEKFQMTGAALYT